MTPKDRQLIDLLRANARESVSALARKLGVARTTVQERLRRLEESGTIAGYTVRMAHAHHHGHHHHHGADRDRGRRGLTIALGLTLAVFAAEVLGELPAQVLAHRAQLEVAGLAHAACQAR